MSTQGDPAGDMVTIRNVCTVMPAPCELARLILFKELEMVDAGSEESQSRMVVIRDCR